VADVNADGKPDIMVAETVSTVDHSGVVGVFLGNGDGTFQAAVTQCGGAGPGPGPVGWSSVAVADVNGDRKLDLIAVGGAAIVGVLLGSGDGTFETPLTYSSGGAEGRSVTVAELNSDGKPDLVVSGCSDSLYCNGIVSVLLGNGDGSFQTALSYSSGGLGAHSPQVDDLNGDTKPDIIVANGFFSYSDNRGGVGVLLGQGDGTFNPLVAYYSGDWDATGGRDLGHGQGWQA
jgi:hypothetical protein